MSINWLELLLLSARNPRAGMSKLLESNFNNFQLLQIAMLAVCLISIFLFLVVSTFVARGIALTYFSRVFNGIGSLRNSILSLAWFDIIHSMGLAIVFIGLWVSPTITILFTLIGTVWLIWIAVSFISVLHNFKNVAVVFFGMIIGYILLHFSLNLIF